MNDTRRRARHVLIVEDDRVTALVLAEYLAAHGYSTSVATNGIEGVAKFLHERPDLALVDALLPKKNGFEACREMKHSEHGRATPVVLMSAHYRHDEQAHTDVRNIQAAAFMFKPFDLEVLLQRVHELVGDP